MDETAIIERARAAQLDPADLEGEGVPIIPDPEPEPAGAALDPDDEDGPGPPRGSAEAELTIPGSGQLSFEVGGQPPTSSTLKLIGGKVEVGGDFSKGEIVTLTIEAQVVHVGFTDKVDTATGQVAATERQHKARIVGVSRA